MTMTKTAFPKRYHLPEWVVPRDVAERLADEDCKREAVKHYLRLNEITMFEVVSTLVQTSDPTDDEPHWCWRHFRQCRTVALGWTIKEEGQVG